jgi:sugar-specific transcriptional regulator TrmB
VFHTTRLTVERSKELTDELITQMKADAKLNALPDEQKNQILLERIMGDIRAKSIIISDKHPFALKFLMGSEPLPKTDSGIKSQLLNDKGIGVKGLKKKSKKK